MHKFIKSLLLVVFVSLSISAKAAVAIKDAGGWLETAWVEWTYSGNARSFAVYVSEDGTDAWTMLDYELMRNYGSYGRADALGLRAGCYRLKNSNFDTGDFYHCTPLEPDDVPAAVTGQYGAGRCQKGDFTWTFDNSVDDASCDLNAPLKAALQAYSTSWVGFFDGTGLSGIESVGVDNLTTESAIYNLSGQKVDGSYKGIVINNGHKVIVK